MEGGGGGGGPAPFLLKTYEMVDDSATDEIVSWSTNKNSFVVWNPPEFARLLLPSYFKHNNFSSFIRQLNTYGFRKIDPERWEFANEEFVRGQKHLLKNIHRRKPIHSHSHPPGGGGGFSLAESERAALEEEIERLSREKAALQADLWRFNQQQSGTKLQLEDLGRRLQDMEQRQLKMVSFLERAVRNPDFVEHLLRMAEAVSVDFSEVHKKRRLPAGEGTDDEVVDNSFNDNHSSTSKPDFGRLFHRDFSNKLRLELSPAVSDCNLVSPSTQSSNEDVGSPQKWPSEGVVRVRMEGLSSVPETLELSDTGTSFCSRRSVPLPWQGKIAEEGDGHILCHLNLTLASSPLQLDSGVCSAGVSSSTSQEMGNNAELRSSSNTGIEEDFGRIAGKNQNVVADGNANVSPLQEANPSSNQAPTAVMGRVNDKFWEQFLTERPGSSDTEEASSCFRAKPCNEQREERKPESEKPWRSGKDMEQLTL